MSMKRTILYTITYVAFYALGAVQVEYIPGKWRAIYAFAAGVLAAICAIILKKEE